ncbi:MAG: response regulator [Plesiomonas sp.]|uniref:response regulator n=1 Tax=Plesiomonas sp. TaxID=2486279 RepID=UPI003F38F1B9
MALKSLFYKKLQPKLMLAFLLIGTIPFSLTACFLLKVHATDLTEQTNNYLVAVRDIKKNQLNDYFHSLEEQVLGFVNTELASAAGGRFYGFVNAFQMLGDNDEQARVNAQNRYISGSGDKPNTRLNTKPPQGYGAYVGSERYRLLHSRFHPSFVEKLRFSDFSDILIANTQGDIVYSVMKNPNFGTNLLQGPWKNSPLSEAFKQTLLAAEQHTTQANKFKKTPLIFIDFAIDPITKEHIAYLAAPVEQNGYLHSIFIFQLTKRKLNSILSDAKLFGKTSAIILVGHDNIARGITPIYPQQTTQPLPLTSPLIQQVTQGKTGNGSSISLNGAPVIAAFTPISVFGESWGLITQIKAEEAFARIASAKKLFLAIMILTLAAVILISHWLSNSITAPIKQLKDAAKKVSDGHLDHPIAGQHRDDELGSLAKSFAFMQASIRDQLDLIKAQNEELAQKVAVIEIQNTELQAADKLKDEFLANTSHELRTPLHGMLGIAESMLAGAVGTLTPQQEHQLAMIAKSGHRLSKLVNELLDYHKMRYGDLALHVQPVDVSAAASMVIELSQHLLVDKPIKIINQISAQTPHVIADEQRLEQILYNLLGNAIKFTNEGKIILSAEQHNHSLLISVRDTGQGIQPDMVQTIFEPLVQASRQSMRSGLGLGLSISRQLVELMQGSLSVHTEPMIGSTFQFTLPLSHTMFPEKQSVNTIQAVTSAELPHTSTDLAHSNATHLTITSHTPLTPIQLDVHSMNNPLAPRILIVDDEPINIQILYNYLSLSGFNLCSVMHGEETIRYCLEHEPDLVLLDVMMPEITGYDVCKALREHFDRVQLPIIMLTALSQPEEIVRGFNAGANDYLTKPFCQDELLARIQTQLDTQKIARIQQENLQLQQTLKQEQLLINSLKGLQQRLLSLLEHSIEPILLTDINGNIKLANKAAQLLLHTSDNELTQHSLNEWLHQPISTLLPASHEFYQGNITLRINDELHEHNIQLSRLPASTELGYLLIFKHGATLPNQRVQTLENALESLVTFAHNGNQADLEQLRALGSEFAELAARLQGSEERDAKLREVIVDAMKTTLLYWEESSGKGKFDLAEQSGLWRVYIDRGTLQTRTLDKYLQIETLPKTPRWRTVLSTLDFVLQHSKKRNENRTTLENLRQQLQQLLK